MQTHIDGLGVNFLAELSEFDDIWLELEDQIDELYYDGKRLGDRKMMRHAATTKLTLQRMGEMMKGMSKKGLINFGNFGRK